MSSNKNDKNREDFNKTVKLVAELEKTIYTSRFIEFDLFVLESVLSNALNNIRKTIKENNINFNNNKFDFIN